MKKRVYILLLLIWISSDVFSQFSKSYQKNRDSFLKYEYVDTVLAKKYLQNLNRFSKSDKSKESLVDYYLVAGWYEVDRSNFVDALKFFKKSASLAKKYKFPIRESNAYGNMATVYLDLNDPEKSMVHHKMSLLICENFLKKEKKDTVLIKKALIGKSAAYGNLGVLFSNQNKYQEAISYTKKAMHIDSSLKNYDFLSSEFSVLTGIYRRLGKLDSAIILINTGLKLRRKLINSGEYVNEEGFYEAYSTLGGVYRDLGNYDSAKHYFEKCYEHSLKIGDKNKEAYYYIVMGALVLDKKEYKKSIDFVNKALEIYIDLGFNDRILSCYNLLGDSYEGLGNYKKSLENKKLAFAYKDSVINYDKIRSFGKAEMQLEMKYKSTLDSLNYERKIQKKQKLRELENEAHRSETKIRNYVLIGVSVILITVFIFSIYLIRLYRDKKKANELIFEQKRITDDQLLIIADKQKEIVDSINYAKRIQYALLAHEEVMNEFLPEHFILFRPKDIVSGDFYWFTHYKDSNCDYSFLAVCDSTGHGVPGAFMSLLNISFINEAITEKNILEPNHVFNHVRKRLIENLGKDGGNDGFDGILLRIDNQSSKMDYAASNNSPIIITETETLVLDCDKMPVGKGEMSSSFLMYEIPQDKNGVLYLPTDGYSDQFGGEKGKKLKYSNMLKYFAELKNVNIKEHSKILDEKFCQWKGELEQVDDVCIIGVKI